MALQGSHIRFALDVKDLLSVKDADAYISGSIYPDSRYVTKINRLATHPKGYQTDLSFRTSDFRKGWFSHLLYDDVQASAISETIPGIDEGMRDQGEEMWIKRTAVKILQDIEDVRNFDMQIARDSLTYIETPNGEPKAVMREYYECIANLYKNPETLTLDDELNMWSRFGIANDLIHKVRAQVKQYVGDHRIVSAVKKLHTSILAQIATSESLFGTITT